MVTFHERVGSDLIYLYPLIFVREDFGEKIDEFPFMLDFLRNGILQSLNS